MSVFSLTSDQPIIKSYTRDPKTQVVSAKSYPFIYEVTSSEHQVASLNDLFKVIQVVAKRKGCLVKGELSRPLIKESRAGSTDPDKASNWVCLDLDGIENYQTIDLYLEDIKCGGVDYILQWSSSMGIENKAGFRCHVFMMLDKPMHPKLLKHWLMNLNLSTPALSAQLSLTKTQNSLRWPLDITTCQNDKLLYVAPPALTGIPDPHPRNRISIHKRGAASLTLPSTIPSLEALRTKIHDKVNELRTALGIPERKKTQYKYAGQVEYLHKPDSATVTEIKVERGFTYFNLNGGDSWAYYHPNDNPAFIYNFKGEPAYKTEELLPDYWAELGQRVANYEPDAQGVVYLAFREFASGLYWNGIYDTKSGNLAIASAKSDKQLRDFMAQHGQPMGDFVPDWDMEFNPQEPQVIKTTEVSRILNVYRPSEIMKIKPIKAHNPPPRIHKLITHVIGGDNETVEHFYNWIACIAQYRVHTGTAWVLHGTQGTGKGTLFAKILAPILGAHNCTAKRMDELDSEFTGYFKNKLLVLVDEIETLSGDKDTKIQARLRNLITEPTISIRSMYTEHRDVKNFCNLIMASNKPEPVKVPPNDRRYNVGIYQPRPLIEVLSNKEIDTIDEELVKFYHYLMTRPADKNLARVPLMTVAKQQMIKTSRSSVDMTSDALLQGDVEFFWDQLTDANLDFKQASKYEPYKVWLKDVVLNNEQKISRDELQSIFEWCVGDVPRSPNKFTSMLKHHHIHLEVVWKNSKSVRGITTTWKPNQKWLQSIQNEAQKL